MPCKCVEDNEVLEIMPTYKCPACETITCCLRCVKKANKWKVMGMKDIAYCREHEDVSFPCKSCGKKCPPKSHKFSYPTWLEPECYSCYKKNSKCII